MYVWALNDTSSKPLISSSGFELIKPNDLNIFVPPLPLRTPRSPMPTPTLAVTGPPANNIPAPMPPSVKFLNKFALPSWFLTVPDSVIDSTTWLALADPES